MSKPPTAIAMLDTNMRYLAASKNGFEDYTNGRYYREYQALATHSRREDFGR
jgi:hypothetical protein